MFRYTPGTETYVAFLTATRTMQAGAETPERQQVG